MFFLMNHFYNLEKPFYNKFIKTIDTSLLNESDIKNYFNLVKKYSLVREYGRNGFPVDKILSNKNFDKISNDKDNKKIASIRLTFFINTLDFHIFISYICKTKLYLQWTKLTTYLS